MTAHPRNGARCSSRGASRWAAGLVSVVAILVMLVSQAGAQLTGKGGITGAVADSTGARIPGAQLKITNNATGITTKTTSTSTGDYSVSTLDPGTYTITISAAGFQSLSQKNVTVNALEIQTYNPVLQVGASTDTVTVTTAPPALETSNATLGATMENEMYSALPIEMGAGGQPDQRRATDFAALMPGVQSNETNGNATTNTGVVNGSGSRGAASGVYIDGLPFTAVSGEGDPRFVWTAISVDAVDQFQVQTSGYSALYEGMGVQNYTIKQGGKNYHGGVYEYFRNTALDTWGFFGPASVNPLTGKPVKPIEHQNEYGIYLSGPLVPFGTLKNRLFFFGNYDGYRYSRVTPTFMTFPTLAEQGGDFSAVGVNIYDPTTQAACTTANAGKQCRYQFSGNKILGTEISPIAKAMQAMIPTLTNQNLSNNYLAPNFSALSNWMTTNRIDYQVSSNNSLTLVAALGRQASSVPVGQTTAGRGIGPVPYNYGQAYAPKTAVGFIEDTQIFTSHLVNQLKYGFARYNGPTINADYSPVFGANAFGISNTPAGQASNAFPITTFSGVDAPTQWAGTTASTAISNSYILIDNVQWVKGAHTLTAGVEFGWMQYQNNTAQGGTTPLTLATSTNETAGFQSNGTTLISNTGVSYASFLLGYIDKASLTDNLVQETGARFHPISPYVQDDWKVNSKLTVNLGLRWDYYPTYREAHNVLAFFNPTLTNPVTGAPGAIQYAGTGANTCNCSTPVNNYFKNFGPRIGFAYQSDPSTVWRGSFGVIYTHGNGVGGSAISRTGTGTLGFSAAPSFSASTTTYLPQVLLTATNSAIPSYTPAQGVASGNAYGTGYTTTSGYTGSPSGIGYADPYLGGRAPQYVTWSFGVQHQWTPSLTSTITYVGSEGHFLISDGSNTRGYWADQLDPKYLFLGSCLNAAVSKLGSTTAPGGGTCAAAVAGANISIPTWFNTSQSLSTALKPFPQYSVNDSYGNTSNSFYEGLQASLVQRASHGLTYMVNYTWSRAIDDGGTFRSGYAIPAAYSNTGKAYAADAIERTVSTSNQPHHIVVTAVWKMPFGTGRLGGAHAWERALVGGYQFSGIFTANSGSPLVITASSCQTNPAQSGCLPTLNPNFSGPVRVNGKWGKGITAANTAAISYIAASGGTASAPTGPFISPSLVATSPYTPAYTFSNAPRSAPYNLYGPGNYNFDISLRRSFGLYFTKSAKLMLQADMYNLTNHTQFGGIGTKLGSSNFGQVSTQANNSRDVQLSGRIEF